MSPLSMWVIYDHPKDYPGNFVVREWKIGPNYSTPVKAAKVVDTLDEARAAIRELNPDATQLDRREDDDPVITETWL